MEETGKFSDKLNSLNGNKKVREDVLKYSNRLSEIGIDSLGQINRVYKSTDFLAFNDPLKIKNLSMFGIDNNVTDQIYAVEVMDREKGHLVYQFVNTSAENENKGIKRGDILTYDPDKEGKENGTEFSKEFEDYLKEYCIEIIKKSEKLNDGEKQLLVSKIESKGVNITEVLGINNYEDIIYIAAKTNGLQNHITKQISDPERKREFVGKLNEKDKEAKSIDIDQEEQEQEGMTIEEASAILGIEEEKLKEVAGDTGKILGISRTNNVEALSRQLGHKLEESGSEVVMLKIAGPGIKTDGIVLNQNGDKLYSSEDGETKLITELVDDGANGESINDIDQAIKEKNAESKKIKTINPLTGKEMVQYAESGNEKSVAGYESESKLITMELAAKIRKIMEGPGEKSDKLGMVADVIGSTKNKLKDLQIAYHITEDDSLEKLEEQAAELNAQSEVEEIKETVGTVGKAAIGAVAAATGIKMFNEDETENDGRDPRESHHSHEHKLF